jgi:hypothetical protein
MRLKPDRDLPCISVAATRRDRARQPVRIEFLWVCVRVLLAGLLATAAAADEREGLSPGLLTFAIASQPLVSALAAYSAASGVQLLYESSFAMERQSTSVEGEYTREAALTRLLTGTDLTIRYTRANAVTLVPTSLRDADNPPADPLAIADADLTLDTLRVPGSIEAGDPLVEYSRAIQADIESALKRNATTRIGEYRVAVKLWVDPSRMVRRAELLRSSGDAARDVAISSSLQGLVLSRSSPANTPQPVRVVIEVKRP